MIFSPISLCLHIGPTIPGKKIFGEPRTSLINLYDHCPSSGDHFPFYRWFYQNFFAHHCSCDLFGKNKNIFHGFQEHSRPTKNWTIFFSNFPLSTKESMVPTTPTWASNITQWIWCQFHWFSVLNWRRLTLNPLPDDYTNFRPHVTLKLIRPWIVVFKTWQRCISEVFGYNDSNWCG